MNFRGGPVASSSEPQVFQAAGAGLPWFGAARRVVEGRHGGRGAGAEVPAQSRCGGLVLLRSNRGLGSCLSWKAGSWSPESRGGGWILLGVRGTFLNLQAGSPESETARMAVLHTSAPPEQPCWTLRLLDPTECGAWVGSHSFSVNSEKSVVLISEFKSNDRFA